MSPARRGVRPAIDSSDLLEAVAWLGVRWTLMFTDWEITSVNEALDREILRGNLTNAFTISGQGLQKLNEDRGTRPRGRLELTARVACEDHWECFGITCSRCHDMFIDHVTPPDLPDVVAKVIADHICTRDDAGPGSRVTPAQP